MHRFCTHCIPRLYDFRAAKCLSKERLRKLGDFIMRRWFDNSLGSSHVNINEFDLAKFR
jgi:hypothetical protein